MTRTRTCADCAKPISARAGSGRCQGCATRASNAARATPPTPERYLCSECGCAISGKGKTGKCSPCFNGVIAGVDVTIVRKLLADRSTTETAALLNSMGYSVKSTALDTLRKTMLSQGTATRKKPGTGKASDPVCNPVAYASRHSFNLEMRILALYARTAARLGCSVEDAAKRLNREPPPRVLRPGQERVLRMRGLAA